MRGSWHWLTILVAVVIFGHSCRSSRTAEVSPKEMTEVFHAVKTPFKYGVVFHHPDSTKMLDSPSIFRWKDRWMMSYIVYDGRGYETWLAESEDLLHWSAKARILSFTDSTWDANQKAGYMALLDPQWGGTYAPGTFQQQYWMSYLGGSEAGYEAGRLGVGLAHSVDPGRANEWTRLQEPVLAANDTSARWYDNATIFKSTVIRDKKKLTGKPFVMYYNASGDTARYESIAMAVSDDLRHWQRFGNAPVITRRVKGTICGDAQIVQMGKRYVMFYFGAFWNGSDKAFDRFACSYDLMHWTEWTGEDLVRPSEPYDAEYAHKPFVLKWKGIVYHFYTAVGNKGRVIALATSVPLKE
jgi:predicted GH43/DUF377 family glycosyl hydrolase